MNITIANISTKIDDPTLQAAVAALQRQVTEHFFPEWDQAGTLNGVTSPLNGLAPVQGNQSGVIYLGDATEDPTQGVPRVLGYHSLTNAKIPYGFVYLDICDEYGEDWHVTLSHEILELLGDPDAAQTISGPAPNGAAGSVYFDLEVADPTQGDDYLIDGVKVSNFVGKAYFGLSGGSGNTNYLKLPLEAFKVRPSGYCQYEDAAGSHQIQGENVTDRMQAAKKKIEAIRRNPRREARMAHWRREK